MKNVVSAFRCLIFLTILTGLVYPYLVTAAAHLPFFADSANGGLRSKGSAVIGSRLIAQKFASNRYFWPRPSAVDYNPLSSGGSNLGPTSADLLKAFEARKVALAGAPLELLFASGSGLDPEISPAAARFQVGRVATARGATPAAIGALAERLALGPQYGIFGEPRVNVLELNLALDREFAASPAAAR